MPFSIHRIFGFILAACLLTPPSSRFLAPPHPSSGTTCLAPYLTARRAPAYRPRFALHTYRLATREERLRIFNELRAEFPAQTQAMNRRFMTAVQNSGAPDAPPFDPSKPVIDNYNITTIGGFEYDYKNRLFVDEEGVFWILKTKEKRDSEIFNLVQREKLAFLLSRGRANGVEIRALNDGDKLAPQINLPGGSRADSYLTRVACSSNIAPSDIVHTSPARAFSAILVQDILIRRIDPYFLNTAYPHGAPMAIDNDQAFDSRTYGRIPSPLGGTGLRALFPHYSVNKYLVMMIFHKAMLVDNFEKDPTLGPFWVLLRKIEEELSKPRGSENYYKLVEMIWDAYRFGLGQGLLAAEMIDPEFVRQSILEFKKLTSEEIAQMVAEAGYRNGGDAAYVRRFIETSLASLGEDVNQYLRLLSRRDYGLDLLDVDPQSAGPQLACAA